MTVTYPELVAYWPTDVELDPDDDPLAVAHARAERAAIEAWEDRPTDPEEDVSGLLAKHPGMLRDVLAEQERVRRNPVYRVTVRAGERLRARLLWAAMTPMTGRYDEYAAEGFFETEVCECEALGRELTDGRPAYRRHREAARCRWCVILAAFEEQRHQELTEVREVEFSTWWSSSATPAEREGLRAAGVPAPREASR